MATTSTTPPAAGSRRSAPRSLDSAIAFFADRGPASVSPRYIAAAANVNLGFLHRHFGSKAELVTAAIDHFLAGIAVSRAACWKWPDFAISIGPPLSSSRSRRCTPV